MNERYPWKNRSPRWAAVILAVAAAFSIPGMAEEEPGGRDANASRESTVPDSDLTGESSETPMAVDGKPGESVSAPETGSEPVIGANPLFGVFDGVGDVAFPEVPLPMGPPARSLEGGLFPSGSDMLHLMNPDVWFLDPSNAELTANGDGDSSDYSESLVNLGLKIAPAVLTLRAWDEFGEELASGSGFFVNENGVILTDMALVHPEISKEIDYITATTGEGTGYRVTGVWDRDTVAGTALLQSDGRKTPFLKLKPGHAFAGREPVTILAVHETRGLILADAHVSPDEKISGEGWLIIRGQDSPGAVGSPVFDANGEVVAMIAMQLPIRDWVNFAVPIGEATAGLAGAGSAPIAFSKLKDGRAGVDLANNRNFQRAYSDLYEGRYSRAALKLKQLTKTYPRSAESWGLLGLASAKLGAWDEALDCQRRAVALDPSLDESWYQIALASLRGADGVTISPAARESLENTVSARPADRFAWILLAQCYIREGDFDNADRALQQVIKLESDYAPAHFLLGYVRGKRGDLEMAERAVHRCLQLDNRQIRAWFYLGLLRTKRGNPEDAALAFRAVVNLEPDHPHAWLNLAHVLLDQGRRTEARTAFQRHQRVLARRGG